MAGVLKLCPIQQV